MAVTNTYGLITGLEGIDQVLVLDESSLTNGAADTKRITIANLGEQLRIASPIFSNAGELLTSNGSVDTIIASTGENQVLISDSTEGVGLRFGQYVPYQQQGSTISTSSSVPEADHGLVIPILGTVTITLPNGFPEGWQCMFKCADDGNIKTFSATGTLQSVEGKVAVSKQHTIIWAWHIGSNTWLIQGNLE